MSPNLINYHMTVSSFVPWLFCNLPFNSKKPHSYQLLSIYLIITCQYICIEVSELLTYTSVENDFTKYSIDSTDFQHYLG